MLEIETNEEASDQDQAFGAGLLEGYLTKDLINLHLVNTVGDFCEADSTTCSELIQFLTTNWKWIKSEIVANKNDPYWHQVSLVFHQFYGLYSGFYQTNQDYATNENLFDMMITDVKPYLNKEIKILCVQLIFFYLNSWLKI